MISLSDVVLAVRTGQTTAADVCAATLSGIRASEAGDASLNAFLAVAGDDAMSDARRVDEAVAAGRFTRLCGAAIAVKDNICTLDLPTTCGSRILEGFRSPYEATVIRRIRQTGGLVAGKTNLDEFAMGSSTENSAWGPTRNPADSDRVPGGSSGGSAAAVAAGLVHAALGSDTGGSVRQPASFCGVVGVKPTYGRVSRYGLVAFGSSLDQIGTLTRNVMDAAILLEVIAGHDLFDSTSSRAALPDLVAECDRDLAGLTIGVPVEYFGEGLDPAVAALCERALARLETAGAKLREISLPHTRFAIPAYYLIAPAEASSNLARYDGVRYGNRPGSAGTAREVYERTRGAGFGAEVKRRIMLGTFALSAGYHDEYYGRAQRARARITAELRAAFADGIDAIFTPTTPAPAFRIGEKSDDPYAMYLSDVYTVTANLAGLPAASVPIGRAHGLPVGGQILGDLWRDDRVIRFSAALERALAAE